MLFLGGRGGWRSAVDEEGATAYYYYSKLLSIYFSVGRARRPHRKRLNGRLPIASNILSEVVYPYNVIGSGLKLRGYAVLKYDEYNPFATFGKILHGIKEITITR